MNDKKTSVRTLTMLALLVAMSIVFSRVLSISTGFVRFNLGSLPVLLAALLFGLFRALSNVYAGFDFLKALNIPSGVYNMMPYIISLVVLAFTSKSSRAPKAEGIPYDKGQR
mgnify:CR=1 FL=1